MKKTLALFEVNKKGETSLVNEFENENDLNSYLIDAEPGRYFYVPVIVITE